MISSPANRSSLPSTTPAATSSSRASPLPIRPSPSTFRAPSCTSIARPSANAASAPPPSTAGSLRCPCARPMTRSWSTGSRSRPSTPKESGHRTTASSPILQSRLTPSPNLPPAAVRGGRSRTRPSTCSRPRDTTSSTTSGTARKPSPASWSPSTCSPSLSTPPRISPCLPGGPPSLRADRDIGSSSICGPSPLTWSSRTGTTCCGPSPRRRYGRLDQRDAPSRNQPTRDTEPKRRKMPANPLFRIAGAAVDLPQLVMPLRHVVAAGDGGFQQGLRLVEALLAGDEDAEERGGLGHVGRGLLDLAAKRLGLRHLAGVGQPLGLLQGGQMSQGRGLCG